MPLASCPVFGRSALLLSAFAPVLFLYKNKKIKKYARQKVSICAVDKLCQQRRSKLFFQVSVIPTPALLRAKILFSREQILFSSQQILSYNVRVIPDPTEQNLFSQGQEQDLQTLYSSCRSTNLNIFFFEGFAEDKMCLLHVLYDALTE